MSARGPAISSGGFIPTQQPSMQTSPGLTIITCLLNFSLRKMVPKWQVSETVASSKSQPAQTVGVLPSKVSTAGIPYANIHIMHSTPEGT